jgi:4-hydroxybenzoate polyprenyltransferase
MRDPFDDSNRRERRAVIRALLLALVIFLLATFPATWLMMLFLGNLHTGLSYWGTLPLGILVSLLLGGATSRGAYA